MMEVKQGMESLGKLIINRKNKTKQKTKKSGRKKMGWFYFHRKNFN